MKNKKRNFDGNLRITEFIEKPSLGIEPFELAVERFLEKRERKLKKAISDRMENYTHEVPEEWVAELNAIRQNRKESMQENLDSIKKELANIPHLAFALNLGGFPFVQQIAEMAKRAQEAEEEIKKRGEQPKDWVSAVEEIIDSLHNKENESSTVSAGK